jgi:hypothetical protein
MPAHCKTPAETREQKCGTNYPPCTLSIIALLPCPNCRHTARQTHNNSSNPNADDCETDSTTIHAENGLFDSSQFLDPIDSNIVKPQ